MLFLIPILLREALLPIPVMMDLSLKERSREFVREMEVGLETNPHVQVCNVCNVENIVLGGVELIEGLQVAHLC